MADLQKYVNWDGLVYYDGKIKNFIKDKLSPCFKFAGVFAAEELPAPESEYVNYIYQVSNDFTSNEVFDKPDRKYEAGALIYVKQISDGQYRYSVLVEAPTVTTSEILDKFDTLTRQIEDQNDTISLLDKTVKDLDADAEKTNETVTALRRDVDGITSTLTTVSETVDTLSGSVESFEGQLDVIDESITDIRAAQETTTQEISTIKTNITDLDTSVKSKQDKLTSETELGTVNGKKLNYGESVEIDIPDPVFTIDKLTDIEVGGIPVGTDLNGMLITDILKKLLYRVVADVVTNYRPSLIEGTQYGPVFVGATNKEDYTAPTEYPVLEETPSSKLDPAQQGYYKVLNESGEVTEQGFQTTTPGVGRNAHVRLLISAQPKQVFIYDVLTNSWAEYNGRWECVKTVIVESSTGEAMEYYLYQDSNTSNGDRYFRVVV